MILRWALILLTACRTTSGQLYDQPSEDRDKNLGSKLAAVLNGMASNPEADVHVDSGGKFSSLQLAKEMASLQELFKDFDDAPITNYQLFSKTVSSNLSPALSPYLYAGTFDGLDENMTDYKALPFAGLLAGAYTSMLEDGGVTGLEYFDAKTAEQFLLELIEHPLTGVTYDGVAGRHIYNDSSLVLKVAYTAKALLYNNAGIMEVLRKLPQEKRQALLVNDSDLGANSRKEVFDLLLIAIRNQIIELSAKEKSSIAPIVGEIVEKILPKLIKGEPIDRKDSLIIIADSLVDERPMLLCLGKGQFRIEVKHHETLEVTETESAPIVSTSDLSMLVEKLKTAVTPPDIHVRCGEFEFNIQATERKHDKIAKPILNSKGDLYALATVDLVRESSLTMVSGALGYLAANGYLPQSIAIVEDSHKDYMTIASDPKKNRVILPIGHAFGNDRTGLTSQRSLKIVTRKKVNGRNIFLYSYLPMLFESGYSQQITFDDMQKILCDEQQCKGFEGQPSTVAVMTTSCSSASTVDSWVKALVAANERQSIKAPTPLVFGSNQGFDTNSPWVIVSHMDHLIRFAEGIANGKSSEEMLELLHKPLERTTPRRVLATLQHLTNNGASLQDSYEPACVLDRTRFFDGSFTSYNFSIR